MIESEATGFKILSAGTGTWIASTITNLDLGQMAGIIVAVVGLILQILSFIRNNQKSKIERQEILTRMARDDAEHQLKMEKMRLEIKNEVRSV